MIIQRPIWYNEKHEKQLQELEKMGLENAEPSEPAFVLGENPVGINENYIMWFNINDYGNIRIAMADGKDLVFKYDAVYYGYLLEKFKIKPPTLKERFYNWLDRKLFR